MTLYQLHPDLLQRIDTGKEIIKLSSESQSLAKMQKSSMADQRQRTNEGTKTGRGFTEIVPEKRARRIVVGDTEHT